MGTIPCILCIDIFCAGPYSGPVAKNKASIKWTEKQKQVAELLQQGSVNKEIATQLGVAKSLVSKVSKALNKGFTPPPDGHDAQATVGQHIPDALTQPKKQLPVDTATAAEAWSGTSTQIPQHNQDLQHPQAAGDATFMRFVPVTVTVPLTPVMLNAKAYLVERLYWPPDTRWEER